MTAEAGVPKASPSCILCLGWPPVHVAGPTVAWQSQGGEIFNLALVSPGKMPEDSEGFFNPPYRQLGSHLLSFCCVSVDDNSPDVRDGRIDSTLLWGTAQVHGGEA